MGRGERLQPITKLRVHALEPTNCGSRVPVSEGRGDAGNSLSGLDFNLDLRPAVEIVVDGVGDVAVGGGKSKGVLPQGRRCVVMPEAGLGLEDLAPAQSGRKVARLWRNRCREASATPASSRIRRKR